MSPSPVCLSVSQCHNFLEGWEVISQKTPSTVVQVLSGLVAECPTSFRTASTRPSAISSARPSSSTTQSSRAASTGSRSMINICVYMTYKSYYTINLSHVEAVLFFICRLKYESWTQPIKLWEIFSFYCVTSLWTFLSVSWLDGWSVCHKSHIIGLTFNIMIRHGSATFL